MYRMIIYSRESFIFYKRNQIQKWDLFIKYTHNLNLQFKFELDKTS